MKFRALAPFVVSAVLLLAACSKITQENFDRIQDGMSEQDVTAILGSPAETSSGSILGISGTSSKWAGGGAVITIRFVNGKVAVRKFDKPPSK